MPKEFDARQAAARGYTREDWDAVDSPELTDAELATLRPMREALPEVHAALVKARKPGPVRRKTLVSVRLDDDVLERLRASGPGWQSRVNDAARMMTLSPDVASAITVLAQQRNAVPSSALATALAAAFATFAIVDDSGREDGHEDGAVPMPSAKAGG